MFTQPTMSFEEILKLDALNDAISRCLRWRLGKRLNHYEICDSLILCAKNVMRKYTSETESVRRIAKYEIGEPVIEQQQAYITILDNGVLIKLIYVLMELCPGRYMITGVQYEKMD